MSKIERLFSLSQTREDTCAERLSVHRPQRVQRGDHQCSGGGVG